MPFTALFLCYCPGYWQVNICCVTNFLCFFTLETEFILEYFYLFIPNKALSWSLSEASKWYYHYAIIIPSYYRYGAFVLLLLLLLLIMPIDSRTWYARIGVFQSTKIVTQSNSFQNNNLNFTVQNVAFMYKKMSIKFFLTLFFMMWVLLKINFDTLWSVIAKCIKGSLMSTHFVCEIVFTKQLIELY